MRNLLTFFIFNLFFITSYAQSLSGRVSDTLISRKYDRVRYELKLKKVNSNKEYFTTSDIEGNYRFSDIETGNYQFIISNELYEKIFFLIKINGDTSKNFFVKKYCKYDENNNSICPRCKSSKKVIPIFYGLTTLKFIKKNKKKYHFSGCEISNCMPKWYCKKHRLEF